MMHTNYFTDSYARAVGFCNVNYATFEIMKIVSNSSSKKPIMYIYIVVCALCIY